MRTPSEVFKSLVNGVSEGNWQALPDLYAEHTDVSHPFDPHRSPALRTRDELREHFHPTGEGPDIRRQATNITIHETTDPEVLVAEFTYEGTADQIPFTQPAIFVLRIRNGQIVESRDYLDPLTTAQIHNRLDAAVKATKARTKPTNQPQ
ncbi:ketosteroid isomerase-like protein [Actinoplanes lutulentus]|uniref:Ketosteroid isomerase-like protein n=1 Tax=Actinoplanes lutulentus TaxID=1287878 RepID=A0A327Z0F3_9ACTN|nr:nuclear transport factor 2 family protein [Actinoplanes lutulentus]MBB2947605.1 ketosteroid isomerase-like protein [Actinoplanes lutulentus]RAK27662.1 ketosteroid isomerase-like protein [Actinoplanes lutulentus]